MASLSYPGLDCNPHVTFGEMGNDVNRNPPLPWGVYAKGNLSFMPSVIPILIDAEKCVLIRLREIYT